MRRASLVSPYILLLTAALAIPGGGCASLDGASEGLSTPGGLERGGLGGAGEEGPLALAIRAEDDLAAAGAPFSFTASDGTGLHLASVESDTAIEDPIALTQLHLTFDNPEDRVLEGRFTITLPEGASISRFAMKIGEEWQEAEVVEKQRARVTYEEFLHRRKDPALLEQGAGNEFAVRIFPIAAKERREIAITYAEAVGGSAPYRLRLAGLPNVGRLDARVFAAGRPVGSFSSADEAPKGDLVVPSTRWTSGGPTALRSEGSLVARVRVPGAETARAPIQSAIVLFDTSASRALDFERALSALRTVVGGMEAATPLRVAAFDQDVGPIYEGEAGGFGEAAIAKLRTRGPLGASDLGAALAWAGATARGMSGSDHRIIAITDGVTTAGEHTADALASAARRLAEDGVERLDAVAVGGIRDATLLEAIARGALPEAGVVVGVEEGAVAVNRRLGQKTLPPFDVAVEGASWTHPRRVEGAQPGDDVVVYAEVPAGTPAKVRLLGADVMPRVRSGPAPLVERTVAAAKIQSLLETRDLDEDARRASIVALSTKHRVVSPHTSLLVLETDADYARFDLDRTAKVDVLVVHGGQVGVASHPRSASAKQQARATASAPAQLPAQAPEAPSRANDRRTAGTAAPRPDDPLSARGNLWGDEIGDAFGASGLGLSGIGEGGGGRGEGLGLGSVGTLGHGAGTGVGQGFGSGSGRLGGAHRSQPPRVRMGATTVSGRLPPEVIQRIVRQNFGRFRLCYENGLRQNPNLQGRVAISFTIGRDGMVSNTRVSSTDLPSAAVGECVRRAFLGLSFPEPEGGLVTVTYPMVFTPGGGDGTMLGAPTTNRPMAQPRPPQAERGDPLIGPNRPEDPYDGQLRDVMAKLHAGKTQEALALARSWRKEQPGDVLALVALGEAAEASADLALAARAYGSILELWSYRVDMRRFAGERLERLARPAALSLAADAFEGAVDDRPDHPSSHRLHAFSLLKLGRPGDAFAVLEKALGATFAAGRFAGVAEILRDDAGIAGAAWIAQAPSKRAEVEKRLAAIQSALPKGPTLRFVLVWETDASDVDLHVVDGRNEHAYYASRNLTGGGRLLADVTNGYGPEAFVLPLAPAQRAYPYKLRVHYYARGAMGFGMGKVEIVEHDGKGGLRFEDRPFVMMRDRAMVDLGEVSAPEKG